MVFLRIPCIPLATLAYERLCHVRERLGLQHGFEVILGKANSSFTIGKHFVDQLKVSILPISITGPGPQISISNTYSLLGHPTKKSPSLGYMDCFLFVIKTGRLKENEDAFT